MSKEQRWCPPTVVSGRGSPGSIQGTAEALGRWLAAHTSSLNKNVLNDYQAPGAVLAAGDAMRNTAVIQ